MEYIGKWGTLGHKYTLVKVADIERDGHFGAQIHIGKSWAQILLGDVGTIGLKWLEAVPPSHKWSKVSQNEPAPCF